MEPQACDKDRWEVVMEKRKKEKCPKCKKMRGLVHDFGDSKMCALCYWVSTKLLLKIVGRL